MERYKQQLFEMANIMPKYSGIEEGTIQIRPEERHINFPHIHYVHNVRKADFEFIKFSISSNIKNISIIEEKNLILSNKEKKKVMKFIAKNAIKLIKYYNQAEFLDTTDFMLSIKKI